MSQSFKLILVIRFASVFQLLLIAVLLMTPAFADSASTQNPGQQPIEQPGNNGLKVVFANPPTHLDPHRGTSGQDASIARMLFTTLFERRPDFAVTPLVVQDYHVSESEKVYRFRLKPNLLWSDGQPITAHDVVYSFKRLARLMRDGKVRSRGLFEKIEGFKAAASGEAAVADIAIRAISVRELAIELATPYPQILLHLSDFSSMILPQHTIEKYGDRWTESGNIVSSGPFVLTRSEFPDKLFFAKNNFYFAADQLRQQRFEFYFSAAKKSPMRLAQEVGADIIMNLDADAYQLAMRLFPDSVRKSPSTNIERISFNQRRSAVQDIRVRKAIVLALDIDKAIKRSDTMASKAHYLLPNVSGLSHEETALPLQHRQLIAKKLLQEAGYTPDHPLKLILATYEVAGKRQYARYLVNDLRSVGIYVELRLKENYKELRADYDQNKFDISLSGWGGPLTDPPYYLIPFSAGRGYDLLGLESKDFQQRIDDAVNSTEMDEMVRLTKTVMDDVIENYYAYPLLNPYEASIVHPWVKPSVQSVQLGKLPGVSIPASQHRVGARLPFLWKEKTKVD